MIKANDNQIQEQKAFWTYENGEGVCDIEFETRAKATEDAQQDFDERCIENDQYSSNEEDILLIRCWLDDQGNRHDLYTIQTTLNYEYEQSDYEQHNTLHSGAGGVL